MKKHSFIFSTSLSITSSLVLQFAVLGFSHLSVAQGLYNGSSIYVDQVNIYVDGDIINSGLLNNDGVIGVTMDYSNQGKYGGKGALEVYGNTPQRISHNEKLQRLVVKGWGTKYIKGKLEITHDLDLEQGIVRVSEHDELSLKESAVTHGGSVNSYVEGALTVEGTGYKFFPVGKNGIYAPIEFLNVKGSPARYAMEVFENAPVITIENTIVRNGLYWRRQDISGHFGGSPVAIDYDPENFNDINNMLMVSGTDWDDAFMSIQDVAQSEEKNQLITRTEVVAPIIMLGETSDHWAESDFYLSTALSSNASNHDNKSARIFGDRLDDENFHFEVFNRGGSLVYETTSLSSMKNSGWDGRGLNGDHLVSGPYPFRLVAYDKMGKKIEKKGVISILY